MQQLDTAKCSSSFSRFSQLHYAITKNVLRRTPFDGKTYRADDDIILLEQLARSIHTMTLH